MAKARLIRGDQSSAEFDQLRKTVNALLLILENAGTQVTGGATAGAVIQAIADGIASGADTNPQSRASYTGTNLEIVGLKPTAKHPDRPGFVAGTQLTTISTTDKL